MKRFELVKDILRKNNIKANSITQFTTGQINWSFNIDDKYVLKLEGPLDFAKGIFTHQMNLQELLLAKGARVPRILDQGDIDGNGYLLMEKAPGKNLIHDWLSFNEKTREHFIAELAEQLKLIHSITFNEYAVPIYLNKTFNNFADAIDNVTQFEGIGYDELEVDHQETTKFLKDFYSQKKHLLESASKPVLVHHDMHLENVLYEKDKVTAVIDWDWACQAPRSYELAKLVNFFYCPADYMRGNLKRLYSNYQHTNELPLLKKYYKELFDETELASRIRLYLLESLINVTMDTQTGRWQHEVLDRAQQKVDVLYKSDWIEQALQL